VNICVFCSSSNAIADVYFEEARLLGTLIGDNHHNIVYGGSNVGLMHACADAARQAGAVSLGIIPQSIHDRNLASEHDDELIVTPNMRERKYLMRKRSDAFIALPGGFGTLEEILEVITLKQLHYHNKPIVFINTNGFYDALLQQFQRSYDEIFAREEYKKMYYVAKDASDAMEYVKDYQPEELESKWFDVPGKK